MYVDIEDKLNRSFLMIIVHSNFAEDYNISSLFSSLMYKPDLVSSEIQVVYKQSNFKADNRK